MFWTKRVHFLSFSRAKGFSLQPYIFNIYIYIYSLSLPLSLTCLISQTFLLARSHTHAHTYIHTYSHSCFLSQSPTHTYFLETRRSRYISRYMVESRFAKIVSAFFFFFFYVPQSRFNPFPLHFII